jgi:hypothetical protein
MFMREAQKVYSGLERYHETPFKSLLSSIPDDRLPSFDVLPDPDGGFNRRREVKVKA